MMHYPEAEVHHRAVWRSDKDEQLGIIQSPSRGYTALSQVRASGAGIPVSSIGLDEIIRGLGHVRFMKLDCEFAEYPILYTSKELGRVDEIAGESHEPVAFSGCPYECTNAGLVSFLDGQGFKAYGAANTHGEDIVNWFFAKRS